MEKRRLTVRSLPATPKYTSALPVKQNKVNDLRKLVDKYVPTEYRSFYSAIKGDEDVSSETDESDEC